MILFNNNFSSPITKTILSEYFTTITTPNVLNPQIHSLTKPNGGLLYTYSNYSNDTNFASVITNMKGNPKNFQIVTEKFLKVLDKVYTKIWNESFTETAIYNVSTLANLYSCFSDGNTSGAGQIYAPIKFYQFVEGCIVAGVLTEEDRLTQEDQIFISQPSGTIGTNIDTTNNIITFSSNSVIDIRDFNTQEGSYLYGKKLYLLLTPFISNATTLGTGKPEPVSSKLDGSTIQPAYSPWGFFKPKSSDSKFGASLPLATHLFWRIGTPEDKEMALLEGTEVPEIIFDHLDRVSHIDTFQLKVKYGPIQFS